MSRASGGTRASRLRLRVTAAAEQSLRSGHPWLFADSVRSQNRPGAGGELGVVFDRHDRFLCIGLYDPNSPIRLRVLHRGKPVAIDGKWWSRQLEAAVARRAACFGADTSGYRWIHGESDGWPGLVLDRYGDVLVLKLYTAAWLPHLDTVLDLLENRLHPASIVLRLSRNIQAATADTQGLADGRVARGRPLPAAVEFRENGLKFEAEVLKGQKTGFFLDQRENRARVGDLAAGRRVLNAFSFSGGFSLYAARGRARSVSDLDISAHALNSGARNWALNQGDPGVNACKREAIQADVFDWLASSRRPQFDLVILDPPSLARRESERPGALAAYERLAHLGLRILRPAGVLVCCSCSAHVSPAEFFACVRRALARSGRRFEEMMRTGHPVDHPASFPEAEYLKALYLRLV